MNIMCSERTCKYCEYGECLLDRAIGRGDGSARCHCFYYVSRK